MPVKHIEINGKLRHVKGWRHPSRDHRDLLYSAPTKLAPLPPAADLISSKPPVRNQGQRGTCVLNASTEAMGYLYIKQKKVDPILSRLFPYYYTRKIENTPSTEDSGCQIRDAMKCLAIYGTCLESTWAYSDDDVQFTLEPDHRSFVEAMGHKVITYRRCLTLMDIKASIFEGYPVVGGFECPANMFTPQCEKNGLIQFPQTNEGFEGGHAVLFIGYDDKKQLLCFQNSWGTNWGRKGLGFLPYQFVTQGLADDFWTIRAENGI